MNLSNIIVIPLLLVFSFSFSQNFTFPNGYSFILNSEGEKIIAYGDLDGNDISDVVCLLTKDNISVSIVTFLKGVILL